MMDVKQSDKLYYSIGEVKEIVDIEPHVLRFWESTFPTLRPRKNSKGQRMYQKKDVEMVLRIKDLLYNKKYTIKGAIAVLKKKEVKHDVDEKIHEEYRGFLRKIHQELKSLLKGLDGHKSEDLFDD